MNPSIGNIPFMLCCVVLFFVFSGRRTETGQTDRTDMIIPIPFALNPYYLVALSVLSLFVEKRVAQTLQSPLLVALAYKERDVIVAATI